ncbi:hypothetical protein RchiOBHm_Chr2g0096941 [Rosa chinensis]|uniref:Inner membrane localized protein n=1 Tax=Rosa chinensis TaxID=74649 RepID=A0A2P6RL71_ROSCH|nr:uncharacterized protein LOC112189616 [Rosa chinensis]PRQ47182.1 hypothetical protein RchiOBHm_Chr2g0096941 [Rosa chinensis]
MSALSSSFVSLQNHKTHFLTGSSSKPVNHCILNVTPSKLTSNKRPLVVRAGSEKSTAGIFVGGFVLGGIIVGALGCVYAPQISKALAVAGSDRKELMKKLPKFIYDEEKALEKTRKILAEKISQLNSAIDDVSAQLHADDAPPNGVAVSSDEIEASI